MVRKRLQCLRRGWVTLLFLFISIPYGCGSPQQYIGTYVTASEGRPPQSKIILELKESGNGVWTTNEIEVPFRWSIKGKEIRLHTREGGVILGEIKKDTIKLPLPTCWMPTEKGICLPTYKVITFKKRHAY